jgi:hypothetical protein
VNTQQQDRDRLAELERRVAELELVAAAIPAQWPEQAATGADQVVTLVRCDDELAGRQVADVETPADGLLSANVGRVAIIAGVWWQITGLADCGGGECVEVQAVVDACDSCYLLTDCGSSTEIVTRTPEVGQYAVVRLSDGVCYEVEPTTLCQGQQAVTVVEGWSDCGDCKCQVLTDCVDSSTVTVYSSPDLAAAAGEVIKAADGRCYTVGAPITCTGSPTDPPESFTIQADCDACACYKLTQCANPANTVLVYKAADDTDLASLVGKIIYGHTTTVSTDYCYLVSESTPGTDDCDDAEVVTILETFDECYPATEGSACAYYELDQYTCDDCPPETSTGTIYTYSDLSGRSLDGSVWLKRAEDGECYNLVDAGDLDDVPSPPVAFTVEAEFEDCDTCCTPQYLLQATCAEQGCGNCSGSTPDDKITDEDLAGLVGQYIKIDDVCYLVEIDETAGTVTDEAPLDYDGPYDSCDACADAECFEVVVDVYVEDGKVKQKKVKLSIPALKCGESDSNVGGTTCDE